MNSSENQLHRRRTMCALALVAFVSAACSSAGAGPDLTGAFVGQWLGSVSAPGLGQSARFALVRSSNSGLQVHDVCADASGPSASPLDASRFQISPFTCPATASAGCSAVTLAVTGGTGRISNGVLWMEFSTTVSGCGSSSPVTYTFHGTQQGTSLAPPMARAIVQGSNSVPVGANITIDASGSVDPAGAPLKYLWQFEKPALSGATAVLTDLTSQQLQFKPDVPGVYAISVRVKNLTQTSTVATVTVIAQGGGAGVMLPTSLAGSKGAPVILDGTWSGDTQGRPLRFSWSLLSAPAGSAAAIADPDLPIAHFTPDVEGTYRVRVQLTAGDSTGTAETAVQAMPVAVAMLPFHFSDARYSRALDRVVIASGNPSQLQLFDPVLQTGAVVALPAAPMALSLSSDGLFAAVSHQTAISYVDLAKARVIATWPAVQGDVVLGDPAGATRFAFVFPSSSQNPAGMHSIDLNTGADTLYGDVTEAGMHAALQPSSNHLFGVMTLGQGLDRFDLDASGLPAATTQWPSQYTGVYPVGGLLWISGDGQQLLTAAGTRFNTADFTYSGTAAVGHAPNLQIASADWSAQDQLWLIQPLQAADVQVTQDASFWTVQSWDLGNPQEFPIPRLVADGRSYTVHGKQLFYDSTGTRAVVFGTIPELQAVVAMKLE